MEPEIKTESDEADADNPSDAFVHVIMTSVEKQLRGYSSVLTFTVLQDYLKGTKEFRIVVSKESN